MTVERELQSIKKSLAEIFQRLDSSTTEYLSLDEAATFLKKPKSTVYQMAGKQIPCRKTGKRLLFLKSELIAWVESHRVAEEIAA